MEANIAVHLLPCAQADYEDFKNLHMGVDYLIDHKNEQSNSIYAFKQTEVHENMVEFWPTIIVMCKAMKIPLTVTLHDIECIFSGFDTEAIAVFYKKESYVGITRKKIIAMEEYRLLQKIKTLFDTIMVRLHRAFKKFPQSVSCPPKTPEIISEGPDSDEYVTFTEAAEMLSVHKSTVSRWVVKGKIRDNGQKGQGRKPLRADVLLVRHKLETADLIDAAIDLRKDIQLIPDKH